jgi:hypothetical protein
MKKLALSYSEVDVCKFVYDFNTDQYKIATESWDGGVIRYYSKPYHSDLISELSDDDPDVFEHETVEAYLLLESGDNALDYEELPAMTFACRSGPIPTIIKAFQEKGINGQYWYNARTKELTDLAGNKIASSEDYDEEDYDYETVPTMKFVYDPHHDEFRTGDEEQTYYDHPHHSELMEDMAETTGNWDMDDVHSGYLYLGESPDNAITFTEPSTFPGMVMTTIPPHEGIIKHFRDRGYPITHWYERKPYPNKDLVLHEIPQELPKTSKLAEVNDFSLIKFVSLPDKFLVGENTHHAYLLSAEYGSNEFPSDTAAIGRAWLENGAIHGIGFDFGTPSAQKFAIEQLRRWAADHGYEYSDNMEDTIQGLASTSFMDQIKEVAESLRSVDYGQCYWNPDKKTVFYNAGDADETEGIEEKFLAIPGVEHVEIGDEAGPPGGWYQLASVPTAFVYANGHLYYGVDHGQIIDDHDIAHDGLYGRLFERPEGGYELELYSDYDPNQTSEELSKALEILSKRFDIAKIHDTSIIPAEDMADAAQFFG